MVFMLTMAKGGCTSQILNCMIRFWLKDWLLLSMWMIMVRRRLYREVGTTRLG